MKRKLSLLLSLALIASFLVPGLFVSAAGEDWLASWANRIKITIDKDQIDATLTHFPVLIYLSAASGIGDVDVSCVFDELTSDANRKKIAVTKADGTTELYVEIEKWDDANEKAWLHASLAAWEISSSVDTVLYLYYDSTHADNDDYVGDTNSVVAESVWDSNFKAVYHMADGASTFAIYDSTGNDNDGAKGGAAAPAVTTSGKVGDAQDFEKSSSQNIILTTLPLHADDTDTEFTVESCINAESNTGTDAHIISHLNEGIFVFRLNSAAKATLGIEQATSGWKFIETASALTVDSSAWYHLASTWKKNDYVRLYKNSVAETAVATANEFLKKGTDRASIGVFEHGSLNYFFDGIIDEVRISNTARSAAWIAATYASLWDALVTFGAEEVLWVSPTGFVDPDTAWTNEANAYDEDTATKATGTGSDLELSHAELNCDKVRVWASFFRDNIPQEEDYTITLDVYYSSDWHNIVTNEEHTKGQWEEISLGSTVAITAARLSMWSAIGGFESDRVYLYEFDFHETAAPTGFAHSFGVIIF